MQLKGRLRRLLSSSTGPTPAERSRRTSDVSENSDISYDRSSGSLVQRVTTSLRTRSRNLRRTASESAVVEESFDGSFAYPDGSSAQPSPFRTSARLPVFQVDKREAVPHPTSTDVLGDDTGKPTDVSDGSQKDGKEIGEKIAGDEDDYPVPSAWGDEPSPEQLQQIQDRVSAWLDTSRPSATAPLRFPSTSSMTETSLALLEVPEEDETEPIAVRQPLRMLDSISEDEVPPFAGSSVSTAPSTPLPPPALPQISRSRSRSPPPRRRSLEGQEDYYIRGLHTIQEASDAPIPTSPRRSLDSMKKPILGLESIPEIESPTSASPLGGTKRRLGIKGFGFARSESEPLMPTFRSVPFNPTAFATSNQSKRSPTLNTNIFIGSKSVPRSGFGNGKEGTLSSPTLSSFQRSAKVVMGQRSAPSPGASMSMTTSVSMLESISLRIHSPGSIVVETEKIENEESRRQTELAFM